MGINPSSVCFGIWSRPIRNLITQEPTHASLPFLGSKPKQKNWWKGALSEIARTLSAVDR
jgi:hypothetical protein